jgi:penicillin-binding protein 1A
MKFFKALFFFFFFLGCFGLGIMFNLSKNPYVDFSVLERYNPGRPSILLDDEGKEWARYEFDKRKPVQYDEIPKHLVHAFMASEDRDFFVHQGLSLKGIVRSTLVNIRHGRIVQGASTITQQLVKLLFFDSKRTFKRKIKEQFFSFLVEQQFTKKYILQTYLNHVYFGSGIYGVEAASQRFFGKRVKDINLPEAATLAAVVRHPRSYSPLLCPLSSQRRRDLILKLMKNIQMISEYEYESVVGLPIKLVPRKNNDIALHLKESLRIFLEDLVGKTGLYTKGYKIKTPLNQRLQRIAEYQFNIQFKKLRQDLTPDVDGALMTINNQTGEVKALIGGVDFAESQFNRALNAKRQMGSIFKPIVYAAAIDSGASFMDTEIDEPLEINSGGSVWKPRNSTRTYEGKITLAKALSFSNNIVTVKTLLRAGAGKVADFAKKCNLPNPPVYPSLSLGCLDVTLDQAVGAFNVFANNGRYVKPYFVKWVKNEWGVKIWKYKPESTKVFNSDVSGKVAKVLSIGPQRFFKRMKKEPFDAIGKTGTTNDSRTCWWSGSTPELTTAIYIGRDGNLPLGNNIYAVWTAFPIWLGMHQGIKNEKKFKYNPVLKPVWIDWVNGVECSKNDENAVEIYV